MGKQPRLFEEFRESKNMLHINDLTYRIAGRVLFENATVAISGGQRVGLVGRNGAGKSTPSG
jgi:ATP-binding cassette subfamily F protein 3